jgi:hypothetical protein
MALHPFGAAIAVALADPQHDLAEHVVGVHAHPERIAVYLVDPVVRIPFPLKSPVMTTS